jgi:hypothetical protein
VTWPDGIALAVGITTLALLTPHARRSTTRTQHRTEAGHGHQHAQDHGEEDHHQGTREEDGNRPRPEDHR